MKIHQKRINQNHDGEKKVSIYYHCVVLLRSVCFHIYVYIYTHNIHMIKVNKPIENVQINTDVMNELHLLYSDTSIKRGSTGLGNILDRLRPSTTGLQTELEFLWQMPINQPMHP